MKKHIIAAMSAAVAIPAVMIGSAGPAAAAPTWVMPDVRNEVLSRAITAIHDVTVPSELKLQTLAKGNQPVYNLNNWVVCAQGPGAERQISQKTKQVILYVKRPGARTCR